MSGWAPNYVDVMWRIPQKDDPDDYVVATDETRTLEEFVAEISIVSEWIGEHVVIDPTLLRPSEIMVSRATLPSQ